MKRLGPWLTLAAVAVFALVLTVIDMSKEDESAAQPNAVVTTSGAARAATVTTTGTATAGVRFPAKADYVGKIAQASGGPIALEITVAADKALAYACDGSKIESWLSGSASDGQLQLSGKNDATLTGRFDGTVVHGTLRVDGKQWDFTAAPVQPPAGLYVYSQAGTRQSWIVDSAGGVTGVQRNPDGSTAAAVGLAPDATAIVGGKRVIASKVSGGDNVG